MLDNKKTVPELSKGNIDYESSRYNNNKRVFSYAHQVASVLGEEGNEVLEIGPGPGIVTNMLRSMDYDVTTVDIDPEVDADVNAHILEMPFKKNDFDIVICCQVLEHLPFSDLQPALKSLKKITKKTGVISLPDASRHVNFNFNLPFFKNKSWNIQFPRNKNIPKSSLHKMGHHWEIGYRKTSYKDICKKIKASDWRVKKTWRVPEIPWHRFFLLEQ